MPSRTTPWSGRPTAQAFWGIPGVFSCGPQLSGSVRQLPKACDKNDMARYTSW
jgi:hypothetical protein